MDHKILDHFKKVDPLLYEIALKVEEFEVVKFYTAETHFINLCREIVGQQLSVRAAQVIYERFLDIFPHKAVTPEYLVTIQDDVIRKAGLSYSKIKYLKDLAQKVIDKEIHLEKLNEMSNEKVIEELTKVKGIGKWTAEMFLIFALGRSDVFSCGDLGLKHAIIKLYTLSVKPTNKELEAISAKWTPYKTHASMILWRSLKL